MDFFEICTNTSHGSAVVLLEKLQHNLDEKEMLSVEEV